MARRRVADRNPPVDIRQKVRSALRRVWSMYSPERKQVLWEARREKARLKKDGTPAARLEVFYLCAECGGEFKADEVEVDHEIAIGATPEWPPQGNEWTGWLLRLFCDEDNLRVLCKDCHREKSREDRARLKLFNELRREKQDRKIPKK